MALNKLLSIPYNYSMAMLSSQVLGILERHTLYLIYYLPSLTPTALGLYFPKMSVYVFISNSIS